MKYMFIYLATIITSIGMEFINELRYFKELGNHHLKVDLEKYHKSQIEPATNHAPRDVSIQFRYNVVNLREIVLDLFSSHEL